MSYGDWNLVDADGNAMAQRESAMSGNRVVTRSGHEVAQVPFVARCPYPTRSSEMKVTFETHEQAMACMNCALAGLVPESHFPLDDGLLDEPCPRCDTQMVWVTPVRQKEPDVAGE